MPGKINAYNQSLSQDIIKTFTLFGDPATTLKTVTPGCGNSVIEPGEQCDDGNTTDGDGCSSHCEVKTTQPAEVTVSSNDNVTYNYSVVDLGTQQPVIDIQGYTGQQQAY